MVSAAYVPAHHPPGTGVMGRARALRRVWAVLNGPGGSAPSTGDLAARAVLQRSGRDACVPAGLAEGEPDGATGHQGRATIAQPPNLRAAQRSPRAPREGRHSEPLCLGRRREFLMKRSGPQATRGSAKTILDKGPYLKCAACRPPRRAAITAAETKWGDRWALSVGAVRGRRLPSARWHGTRRATGAPKQRACWSAATRSGGTPFARGEPAGAWMAWVGALDGRVGIDGSFENQRPWITRAFVFPCRGNWP